VEVVALWALGQLDCHEPFRIDTVAGLCSHPVQTHTRPGSISNLAS
jgi:hypothetical protein